MSASAIPNTSTSALPIHSIISTIKIYRVSSGERTKLGLSGHVCKQFPNRLDVLGRRERSACSHHRLAQYRTVRRAGVGGHIAQPRSVPDTA
eukprot:2360494-Rhodomonas_salina.1